MDWRSGFIEFSIFALLSPCYNLTLTETSNRCVGTTLCLFEQRSKFRDKMTTCAQFSKFASICRTKIIFDTDYVDH